MVTRIGSVVLSASGALALIIGILVWTGRALSWIQFHMLFGFLVVGALWVVGVAQVFSGSGSWIIAAVAVVLGAVVLVFGMAQSAMMVGTAHWVIQVTHLVLGLAAIGVGHMAAARAKKN